MTGSRGHPHDYRRAGVDIDRGAALVRRIAPLAARTARPGAGAALGGFGGVFDPAAAGWRDPLLVAAADGVGTKVLIAAETGRRGGVGIDLVAMCVNDLAVHGAEPLFFLDYYAAGALDTDEAAEIVAGIAEGCRRAGCALIGGETAEMPGLYRPGHYDLAGFAVGAVERDRLLPRADIRAGDALLGIPSGGFHANGFSLIRRIVADRGLAWEAPAPFAPETPLAEALLEPTKIYVAAARAAARAGVKALAHITGGGITENLPRVLGGLGARVDLASRPAPPPFAWIAREGRIETHEMLRTFNCGVGMIAVAAPEAADAVADAFAAAGESPWRIGVATDAPGVEWAGAPDFEAAFPPRCASPS